MSFKNINVAILPTALLLLGASQFSYGQSALCVDSDGDGWGWDGSNSCRPTIVTVCEDTPPLNDGWGWNGATSCRTQITTLTCIDSAPIGDGWGWDGVQSCRVDAVVEAEPVCVDSPPVGDGWGWDGSQSCRLDSLPVPTAGPLQTFTGDNPSVNSGARYTVFESFENLLNTNNDRGFSDVFLRDNQTGTLRLVSSGVNNVDANDNSEEPTISADGQTIVFLSNASNLISPNSNGTSQLYLYEAQTGNKRIITTDANGNLADGFSFMPEISADGSLVAYISNAENLVGNDSNDLLDIFLYDDNTRETVKLTDFPQSFVSLEDMSANGRFIIYKVFPINTSIVNVYVYDTLTRTTEQIIGIDNTPGAPIDLAISDNGRKIVYNKDGTRGQVNVLERLNDTVSVSVISTPEGESFDPAISPDGRYIAYTGTSDRNVYIVDLFGNTETLVSGGNIAGSDSVREGHEPQFTSDGTRLFFTTRLRLGAGNGIADSEISVFQIPNN